MSFGSWTKEVAERELTRQSGTVQGMEHFLQVNIFAYSKLALDLMTCHGLQLIGNDPEPVLSALSRFQFCDQTGPPSWIFIRMQSPLSEEKPTTRFGDNRLRGDDFSIGHISRYGTFPLSQYSCLFQPCFGSHGLQLISNDPLPVLCALFCFQFWDRTGPPLLLQVMLNVLGCWLTCQGQAETNVWAGFNSALRPRKPEGSLGRTA